MRHNESTPTEKKFCYIGFAPRRDSARTGKSTVRYQATIITLLSLTIWIVYHINFLLQITFIKITSFIQFKKE